MAISVVRSTSGREGVATGPAAPLMKVQLAYHLGRDTGCPGVLAGGKVLAIVRGAPIFYCMGLFFFLLS